jgi:hypothetical protein
MAFQGGFMKKIILFLNIVWMSVMFAAHGGGFADQKPALQLLGAGLQVSARERSGGSVGSVGDLVEAFRRLGQEDEPARADDAATQSTQYSDAHSIPLNQFPRPEVGDEQRQQVAAGAQDDEPVRADDAATQSTQYSDAHSIPLNQFPRPEVGDEQRQQVAAGAQDDEPVRADDAATQSTQYSDADVVPLDQFSWPKVGDGPRIEVAAGAQDDVSDVHLQSSAKSPLTSE